MADSYEKRARERRKQQKRRAKLEERRSRDPDEVKEEVPESAWFGLEEEEDEGGENKE